MGQCKRLLNNQEQSLRERLVELCGGHKVFAKVRLADVLPIENSGIGRSEYRFALQAHFDFVVSDEQLQPQFAVEFDGPTHRGQIQQRRDARKDWLCDHFHFPLLRVTAGFLTKQFRQMDALRYFIDLWFLQQAFYAAQESGYIPADEVFFGSAVAGMPDLPGYFPYDLSVKESNAISRWHKEGLCRQMTPCISAWEGDDGYMHAMAWLSVDAQRAVLTKVKIRMQNFGIYEGDLLDDLAIIGVHDKMQQYLQGVDVLVTNHEVETEATRFRMAYRALHASICSPSSPLTNSDDPLFKAVETTFEGFSFVSASGSKT